MGLRFALETRPFQVCLLCSFCSSDRGFAHRELFIPQSGFLQTPPHDGRPCLRLTVPTAKSVVDFHHQVIMRAEHTNKNPPAKPVVFQMRLKGSVTSSASRRIFRSDTCDYYLLPVNGSSQPLIVIWSWIWSSLS